VAVPINVQTVDRTRTHRPSAWILVNPSGFGAKRSGYHVDWLAVSGIVILTRAIAIAGLPSPRAEPAQEIALRESVPVA
jgi:hypothetical protein